MVCGQFVRQCLYEVYGVRSVRRRQHLMDTVSARMNGGSERIRESGGKMEKYI